jgi:signal transduction histidine kinase
MPVGRQSRTHGIFDWAVARIACAAIADWIIDMKSGRSPWHRRARQAVGHSIKLRLVLIFLLLALTVAGAFLFGAQKAFSVGWREAARPLLMDYVDHLAADIVVNGAPDVARAQAITERLPLTIDIQGPRINWRSHPGHEPARWKRESSAGEDANWPRLLRRSTADGHVIEFGLNDDAFQRRPRLIGLTLVTLLLLTLAAFLIVRRMLRPLDDIRAGARRFGAGDFSQPIPVQHAHRPDELGQLAATINTMGQDIQQMLDAKRALLLAISHELRSPLTRARLNTELLPESEEVLPQRQALLRDLQEMSAQITDLLESERLSSPHTALSREPVDLPALAREVLTELGARHARAGEVALRVPPGFPALSLDRARMRLLLRNLLDNALRHGAAATQAPELTVSVAAGEVVMAVRDHGPGVPDEHLHRLSEAFYRPDSARTRSAGGVGLGLYLCKLVAQAHGGHLVVANAAPGLVVSVTLPAPTSV